jgi:hypothetical protein
MANSERYLQDLYLPGNTQFYPLGLPGAKQFFVAPSTYTAPQGETPFAGASAESALQPVLTPAQAYSLVVAGRGDTIVLMPGTYTATAVLALAKSALRIVSLRPWAATITADGVLTELMSIDANDIELAGLRFAGIAALVTMVNIANTTAVRNTYIHHCKFIGLETVAGVTGIINGENVAGNDAAHTTIEHCQFEGISANCIWTFGGGCRIWNNVFNLDDTAAHTAVRIGDQGAAFAARKAVSIRDNEFIGQTDASSLLAITIAGTEANTQIWSMWGNSFASCAAPTAAIHPEGATFNYVGTTTTTAPTLFPA